MAESSSSSTTSSSSSAPSASSSTNVPPSSGGNQGNLYLFTFLATLLVLLLISCSIVFRSFVLRRRYQRRLQEALAVGAILAPRSQGSRRKRFRTRPKFFDTWLSDAGAPSTWDELMPVSVLPIKHKKRAKETAERPERAAQDTLINNLVRSHWLRRANPRNRRRSPLETFRNLDDENDLPSPISPSPDREKPDPFANDNPQNLVQVAILVAMPSPPRPELAHSLDEEEIPEVAFGVTRIRCKSRLDQMEPEPEPEPEGLEAD